MRTVATLAAILALPCVLLADEPQTPKLNITIASPAESPADAAPPAAARSSKFDTSVYALKHTRARQIIPAVRQAICKSLALEAADRDQEHSVVSFVFIPTTADDKLVAICPREDAPLVKEAIEACDVEKQYAVRVQLFEISPGGEAVPAGEPAVIVGREGSVECKASGGCPVTLNLQVDDGAPAAAILSNESVASESADEAYCSGPDCGRPDAECSVEKGACPASATCPSTAETTCPACSGECPACSTECAVCTKCPACSSKGTVSGCTCQGCQCKGTASGGTCQACKWKGTVSGSTCQSCQCKGTACGGTCQACQCKGTVSGGTCQACQCKGTACGGTCQACQCKGSASGSCQCANSVTKCPACQGQSASCNCGCAGSGKESSRSCRCQSLTGEEYRVLVRILVSQWLHEHEEHGAAIVRDDAEPGEKGECCPDSEADALRDGLIAPAGAIEAPAEKPAVELGFPAPAPSSAQAPLDTNQTAAPYEPAPVPSVVGDGDEGGLYVHQPHANDNGFRFGGDYRLCPNCQNDDVAKIRVTDADESDDTPHASGSICPNGSCEPPALLTLAPRKDNSAGLGVTVSPRWQADLSKIYQGRRLSEIFEPRNGQDPGAAALGRMLAEIPKPLCENEGDSPRRHNVIVVDLPDRIRIFDSPSEPALPVAATCTNCREQFRAFLEEVFRSSSSLEEIAQAGHAQEETVSDPPRELPSITQSKLETTVVTYPLHDLVLLDDAERPVFDTCTFIDHIQSAVAPESWWHPSVSIQLDQQSMSLVIRQTPEVHKKIEAHLHKLRRLQVKQLCNLIERLSSEAESTDD